MPLFQFGEVQIDPVVYGINGNAILGIKEGGKTYTATLMAEMLFEAGIPFTAFDPIGVWRFLRVPGAGRGIPVVVAGGMHGDLPLTAMNAAAIMEAAMKSGISIIFDLYSMDLSKADWKRIVVAATEVMLHKNNGYGMRHVFIEEAAEFAPQRIGIDSAQVYSSIEKLARMGGNARLGYTLINQRAEEVNKAVLELCDSLFLHRQKGRHSIVALSKWLDAGAVTNRKAVIESLSTLPTGECWAWMGGSETPVQVRVPQKQSMHPDRRVMAADIETSTLKPVDAGAFVAQMRALLTPQRALAAVAAQTRTTAPAAVPKATSAALSDRLATIRREGHVDGYKLGYAEGYKVAFREAAEQIEQLRVRLLNKTTPGATPIVSVKTLQEVVASKTAAIAQSIVEETPRPVGAWMTNPAAAKLMAGFQRYSDVGLSWAEACIVVGMMPGNGYFYGGRKALLDGLALVERDGRFFPAVIEGKPAHLTRTAFKTIWGSRKQPAPRMFDCLCEAAGEWVSVAELAAAVDLKTGNGFWYGGLSQLRAAGLIEQEKDRVRVIEFIGRAAR